MFAGLQVQAAAYEKLFKEVIGLVNMKKFSIKRAMRRLARKT